MVAQRCRRGGAGRLGRRRTRRPATGTTKTKTETVYPWTSAGKLKAGLKVAGTVEGTCWTSSLAVSSNDAYRCMSKSFIYDPCFPPRPRRSRSWRAW